MFYKLKSLTSLYISNFNTANVEYMNYMFDGCESLTSIDILNFYTSKIESLDGMFSNCLNLKILNLSNFNTDNIISMDNLFSNCKSLISIDLSKFNTSQTTSMHKMFSGCNSLQNLDISHFDTSSVTTMAYLFNNCSSLKQINLNNFNTSLVNNMKFMFNGDKNFEYIDVNSFDTSNVKSMEYMFSGCSSLKAIEVSNFNVSRVRKMGYMFENCLLLTSLNLSNFDSKSIENMDYMFAKSERLAYINFENLVDDNIKSIYNIFSGTPENMVICINESNAKNINGQIKKKGCTIINCSDKWEESRKKIIAKNNLCVDDCGEGYKYSYDYKCYEQCPLGTFSKDNICKNLIINNEECNTKAFFLGKCNLTLDTDEDKHQFIESTTKEILNLEYYDLFMDAASNKKIYTKKLKNEIFQIYSLSNRKRNNETTYIDFDRCEKILRERHRLGKDEDFIIFKIEYIYPGLKIPIIEYQIFNSEGKKKLNLFYCKKAKIYHYIPKEINDYKEYKYNPEHIYYKEKCSQIDDEPIDLVLYDRKNEFNKNNMSLCESHCIFKGYIDKNIICECDVKLLFNSFYKVNSNKNKYIQRFDVKESNENNFWTIGCFINQKIKFSLFFNIYSILNIIIYISIISGAILFRIKEYKLFYKNIQSYIIFLIQNKKKEETNKIQIGNYYLKEKEEEKEKARLSNANKESNIICNIINEENNENKDEKFENLFQILEDKKAYLNNDILKLNSNKLFKGKNEKNLMMSRNKPYKTRNKTNLGSNNISQNSSIFNSKSTIVKTNDSKNSTDRMNSINDKKTDYYLDNLKFKDAKLLDNRTFCQYYLSLIKTNQIIFFIFKPRYKIHSKFINYSFFLFLLSLYLTINTFFVDASTIHNIYIKKGSFDLVYNIPRIIYATIILYFIQTIFRNYFSIYKDIFELDKIIEEENKYIEILNEKFKTIIIKNILFFAISLIILNLCGLYIGCFSAVFSKTKIHLFIRLILSLLFSFFIPLVIYLLSSIFRFLSLRTGKETLYIISQYLQVI